MIVAFVRRASGRRVRRTIWICGAALLACGLVTALAVAASTNFAEPASSPEAVGDGPDAVAVGDLDGDADQDLAVANSDSSNVTILRNNGSGNFGEPKSSPETVLDHARGPALADLDGDGDLDLAVPTQNLFVGGQVEILLNNGSGDFTEPATSPEAAGDGPSNTAAARAGVNAPSPATRSPSAPACTSIPRTMSGFRPRRSDSQPVASWPAPQTAG